MYKKELVDKAIKLDMEIKNKKKELDELKTKLQSEGLENIENMNIKFIQFYGDDGSCDIAYKRKCEVDNVKLLREIFGEEIEDKITKEEKITYTLDSKFKEALIALYMKDYKQNDIDKILLGLGLDNKQIKLAKKRLKGDYFNDKAILESLNAKDDNLEEELDAIRESKNYELINKFTDIENFTEENYKNLIRAITVEETLSVGLSYDK